MASLSEILTDLRTHLEHGAELLASHVPALVELAAHVESDPLVKTAIDLVVPPTTRDMLATLLKSVEADAAQVAQAAITAEQQRQAAAVPVDPSAPPA